VFAYFVAYFCTPFYDNKTSCPKVERLGSRLIASLLAHTRSQVRQPLQLSIWLYNTWAPYKRIHWKWIWGQADASLKWRAIPTPYINETGPIGSRIESLFDTNLQNRDFRLLFLELLQKYQLTYYPLKILLCCRKTINIFTSRRIICLIFVLSDW